MKTVLVTLGFLVLVFSPVACGKSENVAGSATVTGKVLWDKNPLSFGSVQFYGPEMFHTTLIQNDGSYKLGHLPEGPVTVCIRTRGELYADSRSAEEMKKHLAGMKEKLPDGMTMEEMKEQMLAKTKMGQGGKPGLPAGKVPMMFRKGPRDAQLEQMPLVNGMPVMQAQSLPPEALQMMAQIHDKYGEFGKSPLNYTVLPGAQSYDIILK